MNVTITKEGTSAPQIVDDSDRSPLSNDEELMRKWIFDEKKWQDVFTCKPYDYLKLVSEMRVPWFDKEKGKWVDKEEFEKEHGKSNSTNEDAEKAEQKVAEMAQAVEYEEKSPSVAEAITINNDSEDLPF